MTYLLKKCFHVILCSFVLLSFFLINGCAPTHVNTVEQNYPRTPLPKPNKILVYDYIYSPEQVKLNQGLGVKIEDHFYGAPKSQQELMVASSVAHSLSNELVKNLRALGLPAERATWQKPEGNVLAITGHFIDIDQGNRLRRMVIGFGVGGTQVATQTQVIDYFNSQFTPLYIFNTTAKSSVKPGMGPLSAIGAAAGHAGTSILVSSGVAGVSEILGASPEDDAKRTAKEIVKKLTPFFILQGWISGE